jgi:hypothetical protein
MNALQDLFNMGKTLTDKLNSTGLENEQDLKEAGRLNDINKIAPLDNSDACIYIFHEIRGVIHGIRVHRLGKEKIKTRDRMFINAFIIPHNIFPVVAA